MLPVRYLKFVFIVLFHSQEAVHEEDNENEEAVEDEFESDDASADIPRKVM